MTIREFIQQEILLPRLQQSSVLVIYDPARRYHDLCLDLATPDRKVGSYLDFARPAVNATIAQKYGYNGNGIGVAILDSGVKHRPDLNVWGSLSSSRVVADVSFVPGEVTATCRDPGVKLQDTLRTAEASSEQLESTSHRAAAWMAQGDLAARKGEDATAARLYRQAAEALQDFHF